MPYAVHRLSCYFEMEKSKVKIRITKIDPERPYEEYQYLEDQIPEGRRKKIQRFRFEPDKIRSLVAGVLLQEELDAYLANQDASCYELKEGEHGKPYLSDADDFHFSISHAGEYVVLVTDDQPIGIDVEKVQIRESVARRFYSKREQEEIRVMQKADEKQGGGNRAAIAFTKVWTGKEAYLKYTGNGITNALAEIEVLDPVFWRTEHVYFAGTPIADGTYYVTICSEKQVSISDKIIMEDMT